MFLSLIIWTAAAMAAPAGNDSETPAPLETSITDITVFADRALIRRVGTIELTGGVHRVALRGLPVWLDGDSVRARVEPAEAGEIVDVQLEKVFLVGASDQQVQQAEQALLEITDQIDVLDDELSVLEARQRQVEGMSGFIIDKTSREAVSRDIPIGRYQALVGFVSDELTAVATRRREIAREKRALQPELQAREGRLQELQNRSNIEEYTVVLTVRSRGNRARVIVEYLLPGATWEPQHDFRFTAGENEVLLSTSASITQTTGENWIGATIRLSTQSTAQPVQIPELEALLVGENNAGRLFAARSEDSFSTANRLWMQQRESYNVARGTVKLRSQDYSDNVRTQVSVGDRVTRQFQLLQQKRGTTALYEAAGSQTVRSDGRPVRVPLTTQRMQGRPRTVAAPEISLNATRTAQLVHNGEQPILPGRVALFDNGAFIGYTEVDFVGSGEQFALFAGLVDDIKLSRTIDRAASRLRRGRKTTRVDVTFVVEVENLADRLQVVELADRVPVSDNKEIRVTGVGISPETTPSSDGLLLWQLEIPAASKRTVTISYTVEYPTGLPEVPLEQERLKRQLEELEQKF
jgi:uncharacterized protein (TIGR02231 family)